MAAASASRSTSHVSVLEDVYGYAVWPIRDWRSSERGGHGATGGDGSDGGGDGGEEAQL